MSLKDCRIIELTKIADPRGSLTAIEAQSDIPFEIKRVYYLYDIPAGASRAGHAHKFLEQLIIAMSGSFDVELDDGFSKRKYQMNRPYHGLYVPRMIWRDINNFSSGSVCIALASTHYQEADYYRDYGEFKKSAINQ